MKASGSNGQDIKQKNRILVLQLIAENTGVSRVDISRMTGLSKMTIGNIVTELIEEKLIIEQGRLDCPPEAAASGRRPIILSLSPASPCICGMLIKRELCQIIIGDLAGHILDEVHYEYSSLSDGEELVRMLCHGYQTLSRHSDRHIIAISISSLGPVDGQHGVISKPPHFYNIRHLPIVSLLEKQIGLPTFLVNDANAGALAEKMYGIGKNISNFCYLHIMNGIGSGLILRDSLYNGDAGQSGEIGHTSINFAGPPCACGNRGCLELYANVDAMRRKIKNLSGFYPSSPLAGGTVSWRQIVDCAERGDHLALLALDDFCSYLSGALLNTLNLLDLSTLIVGYNGSGGVIERLLQARLAPALLSDHPDALRVLHSSFGGDAPLIGSIAFAADKIFSLQFPLSS